MHLVKSRLLTALCIRTHETFWTLSLGAGDSSSEETSCSPASPSVLGELSGEEIKRESAAGQGWLRGGVVHRGKRCIKMSILVKTKGQGIDTLWVVLTALLPALAKLSVWSVGKRNTDGGSWRLRGLQHPILLFEWSAGSVEVFKALCLVSPAINCFYSWCFFSYPPLPLSLIFFF